MTSKQVVLSPVTPRVRIGGAAIVPAVERVVELRPASAPRVRIGGVAMVKPRVRIGGAALVPAFTRK